MRNQCQTAMAQVHCRIGSLESPAGESLAMSNVHCRIGSLETGHEHGFFLDWCSLPNRQLRNSQAQEQIPDEAFTAE